MTTLQTFKDYRFGSHAGLTPGQMHALIEQFHQPPADAPEILAGRLRAHIIEISGLGRVVIKHYLRGGILRHINQWTYVKCGKTRAQAEYELLEKIRGLGINAPEPVAYAFCGKILYHAWLITREIEAVKSLAEVAFTDPERAHQLLGSVTGQISRLIEHQIHHVDMHPGNVLVGPDDTIYLIDFDKAGTSRLRPEKLATRYCRRWHRAIVKHHLPDALNTEFEKRLMAAFKGVRYRV